MRLPSLHIHWHHAALDLPLRRALIITAGIVLVFALSRHVPFMEGLDARTSHGLEFTIRHRFKRDPPLDPRIVIYALGDSSIADLKKENLELKDWALLFKALDAAHPRAILIDKVFSAPLGLEDAQTVLPELQGLGTPVIAGAFVASSPIVARPLQNLMDLNRFFSEPGSAADETSALDSWPMETGYPYGPAAEIQSAFKEVGHVMYADNLTLKPILRLDRHSILPALPILPGRDLHFHAGQLYAEGNKIPVDPNGRVLINLSSPEAYYDRTYKLSKLLERAQKGIPISLPPDAVVVILPALFTGNTDVQPSPFGVLPGGYFITAILNSVLTGNWIKVVEPKWLFVGVGGVLGFLAIFLFSGPSTILVLASLSLLMVGIGLFTFIWLGIELPWLACLGTTLTSALALSLENSRVARAKLMARGEAEKDFAHVMDAVTTRELSQGSKHGVRLGRYHMLEVIGQGGMGEVYRAKAYGAGGFEKEFAIKRIGTSHLSRETSIRLFEEEARLTSVLTHANIAQVFEFFRMNETYLMVMEFIAGKNLAQLMSRAQDLGLGMSEILAAQIIDEVFKGLEYAHGKCDVTTGQPLHITHRDISPQNIMLSYEGAVKLIDFGIAKNQLHQDKTAEGTIKGKFAYMSPEQGKGGPVDSRSDLFSAGLIFYELLTGMRVLEGGTDIETIDNVRKCRIPAAVAIKPDLPERLDRFLAKCLAKEPSERFPDATSAHAELQLFLREFPYHSLPHTLSTLLKTAFPREYKVGVQPEAAAKTTVNGPEDMPTRRLVG